MKPSEKVVHLAARGDGVTDTGRYVAGTAPGDTLIDDAIVAGPHRANPPCIHYGACGGCQLQHVDELSLGDFVSGRIVGALAGAGIAAERVRPVHLSSPFTRRRASLRAVLDGRSVRIGFNSQGSNEIVDLTECHVLTPDLWAAVRALRPVLVPLLRRGIAASVTLTETASGIDLLLSNVDFGSPSALQALTSFAHAARVARLAIETASGTEIVIQLAEPVVRLDGVLVGLPPGGFLQATRDGEFALQSAVAEVCYGAKSIADLFCGIGTFALPLSAKARVLAVDAAGPALQSLAKAASQAGRGVSTEHRDLFRQPFDRQTLDRYDVVVMDPPRAGAKAQSEILASSKVKKIAYVSCNPNTFARDAKILVDAGYRLVDLWPVGQFRWSTHVELVAHFAHSRS